MKSHIFPRFGPSGNRCITLILRWSMDLTLLQLNRILSRKYSDFFTSLQQKIILSQVQNPKKSATVKYIRNHSDKQRMAVKPEMIYDHVKKRFKCLILIPGKLYGSSVFPIVQPALFYCFFAPPQPLQPLPGWDVGACSVLPAPVVDPDQPLWVLPAPDLEPDQPLVACLQHPVISAALETRLDIQSPARSCFK
jgi:hypothetical protein